MSLDNGSPTRGGGSSGRDPRFDRKLAELHPRLNKLARRWALREGLNEADAEDIVSFAVDKALRNPAPIIPGKNIDDWFSTVLKNAYRDVRKSLRLRSQRLPNVAADPAASSAFRNTPSEEVSPLRAAMYRQQFDRVKDAIPPKDFELLVLHHVDEFSIAEIAVMLNFTEAKVKMDLYRARIKARKALAAADEATDALEDALVNMGKNPDSDDEDT